MLKQYATWVRANSVAVKRLEEVARTATLFIPGRFSEAELVSEGLYGVLNLISVYHDRIILCDRNEKTELSRVFLTILAHCEVVAEMVIQQLKGEDAKWTLVERVETLKALYRLILLFNSNGAMIINGGQYTSPVTSTDISMSSETSNGSKHAHAGTGRVYTGKRSGKRISAGPIRRRAGSGSMTSSEEALAGAPHGKLRCGGELLHLLRPLVYVYLCKRFGRRSWVPWMVSLVMDMVSWNLAARGIPPLPADAPPPPSPSPSPSLSPPASPSSIGGEASVSSPLVQSPLSEVHDELTRRKFLLLYYLLRSPVFETMTRPSAIKAADAVSGVPLVGGLASYGLEMLAFWNRLHFYSSAS